MKRYLPISLSFLFLSVMTLMSATATNAETIAGQTVPLAVALTVDTDGAGEVNSNPAGSTHVYGQVVALNAVAAPGWTFSRWESKRTPAIAWQDALRDYRTPITVSANGEPRNDQSAEIGINFTVLLNELGVAGPFDPASIHVVELDASATPIDDEVPFQFTPDDSYDSSTNASGTLILFLRGQTDANQERRYHVYFGLSGVAYPDPNSVPPMTLTTDGIDDEGQAAFKVATLSGTYYYQKTAGGFSSLVDGEGNDWINFNSAAGPDGLYRGMPNAVAPADGGHLHPGQTSATTTVVEAGPLKVILSSTVLDGSNQLLWEADWQFYPSHATMTLNTRPSGTKYWFLYEGTPGGSIGPEDSVTRADGTQTGIDTAWEGDFAGDEWAFFADANLDRSLFLAKHGRDNVVDAYKPYTVSEGGVDVTKMTIFGFGRALGSLNPQYDGTPNRFTIGLTDRTSYASVKSDITAIFTDLAFVIDTPEQRLPLSETLPATNPVNLSMIYNRHVTAVFTQNNYDLAIATVGAGAGVISVEPNRPTYHFGDEVTVTASPYSGSHFSGWTGAVSGNAPTTTFTIYGNSSVTATFDKSLYDLTVIMAGDGQGVVNQQPSQASYYYGESVTLTAEPALGSDFAGWDGVGAGGTFSTTVTLFDHLTVTATFTLKRYSVTAMPKEEGQGAVTIDPEKTSYVVGDVLELQAQAADDWHFSGWSGDLSGDENPSSLTVDGDMEIIAEFVPLHDLEISVNDEEGRVMVTPNSPEHRYPQGSTVTIEAVPEDGWRFSAWTGDWSGDDNPLAIQIEKDSAVTAIFVRADQQVFLPVIVR